MGPKKYPPLTIICLAAGLGSRLKNNKPKPLVELWGQPLLGYVAKTVHHVMTEWQHRGGSASWSVVTNPHDTGAAIATYAKKLGASVYIQDQPLGTAHAVLAAADVFSNPEGVFMILCADTPLIQPETLLNLLDHAQPDNPHWAGSFLAMQVPAGHHSFGCLEITEDGTIQRILEAAERSSSTPASGVATSLELCNSGVVVLAGPSALNLLRAIGNTNAKGEFYLTDLPVVAASKGYTVTSVIEKDATTLAGINTAQELAHAGDLLQHQWRQNFLERGVILQAPSTFFASFDTHLEAGVVVEPNVICGPGVHVAGGAVIRSFSHLEGVTVLENAVVGPFARIRPGTTLNANVRVGNFVEIKNSNVEEGAKVSHLSYLGDAKIGEKANIGAGTITCNYDGQNKHATVIGAGAFIGSNTALVAPVSIGQKAVIGAGSVITKDVAAGSLALSRSPQKHVVGYAARKAAVKQPEKVIEAEAMHASPTVSETPSKSQK